MHCVYCALQKSVICANSSIDVALVVVAVALSVVVPIWIDGTRAPIDADVPRTPTRPVYSGAVTVFD